MDMDFALAPVNGPPRLWRYVESGSLGYIGGRPVVTLLMKGNILKIDRELFDQLSPAEQHIVLRTHNDFEVV